MSIEVDYRFPAGSDAAKQARVIAIGQTAGTWDERYAHRAESLRSHLAEVVDVRPAEDGASIATVRFPEQNVDGDLGSLLTMIYGKYSMAGAAKVMAVRLPENYGQKPKFGLSGVRALLGVQDRPVVMAIFKPALGLSAADHGALFRKVAFAGLDVIKDDEVLGNAQSAPTLERLRACLPVIEEVKRISGRTVLYAVNVTGRADQLIETARKLVAEGANALLVNALAYGYSVIEALAADPRVDVPIFTHPSMAGALCGAPDHGLAYSVVLGTLMAHAGADAVLFPAHYGSLPFDAKQEALIRDALRARNVFPVPSAGIHPGVVPRALADYGRDVVLNAGTGIMDHPDGPEAGVAAFFQALDLAEPGKPFDKDRLPAGPLRQAVEKWGSK